MVAGGGATEGATADEMFIEENPKSSENPVWLVEGAVATEEAVFVDCSRSNFRSSSC